MLGSVKYCNSILTSFMIKLSKKMALTNKQWVILCWFLYNFMLRLQDRRVNGKLCLSHCYLNCLQFLWYWQVCYSKLFCTSSGYFSVLHTRPSDSAWRDLLQGAKTNLWLLWLFEIRERISKYECNYSLNGCFISDGCSLLSCRYGKIFLFFTKWDVYEPRFKC